LWVSYTDGLYRVRPAEDRLQVSKQILRPDHPDDIFFQSIEDRRGWIWAPGTHGIAVLRDGEWTLLSPADGMLPLPAGAAVEAADVRYG
jgi:hypothetical protein